MGTEVKQDSALITFTGLRMRILTYLGLASQAIQQACQPRSPIHVGKIDFAFGFFYSCIIIYSKYYFFNNVKCKEN